MKKTITVMLLILAAMGAKAQDIITTKDGDDIKSKVIEVGKTEIRYKKFSSLEGATYVLDKADVLMIRYQDGTKDIFKKEKEATNVNVEGTASSSPENAQQMASKGTMDAKEYYTRYKPAYGWTMTTTWVTSPLFGLIPAIACSSAPPIQDNLGAPNQELMRNRDYHDAYEKKAFEIKKRKTWTGYGIGAAVWVGLVIIISVAAGG